MKFIKIEANITDCPADVIVNSIGVNGGTQGAICQAILNATKESYPFLEEYIKSKNAGKREIFSTKSSITKGLNPIKAGNIYHYVSVTAYSNKQAAKNDLFEDIVKIINLCFEDGYKSVGIPRISTGYNDLDSNDFKDVIARVKKEYEKDTREFVVYLVEYHTPMGFKRRINAKTIESSEGDMITYRGGRGNAETVDKHSFAGSIQRIINLNSSFMLDRSTFAETKIEKPFDFIEWREGTGNKFVATKRIREARSVLNANPYLNEDSDIKAFPRKSFDALKKKKVFSLPTVVMFADMLQFNREDFMVLLIINGISLNPFGTILDKALLNYWEYNDGIEEVGNLIEYCISSGAKPLFEKEYFFKKEN